MSDEIKSALEIAMEKVAKMDKATDEQRLKWKYVPEGEKLAVKYMKDEGNLLGELGKYDEPVRKYVAEGATGVLAKNISLPRDDEAKKNNRKVMDGIKMVKTDKVGVENIYSKMRRIFSHYSGEGEKQRKEAYVRFKADFENKAREAMKQQGSSYGEAKINVEQLPQFQAEWRKLSVQFDTQYLKFLDEFKAELSALS